MRLLEAIDGQRTIQDVFTGEIDHNAVRSVFQRRCWHDPGRVRRHAAS